MPIEFNLLKTLAGHGYDVNAVAFSRDGRLLASAGGDKSVRLWAVQSPQELHAMNHGEWVNEVAFAPSGAVLASAGRDGAVKLWNTETGQPVGAIQAHPQNASSVAFSPDGTRLASGGGEGGVRIVNLREKKLERAINAHQGWVWRIGFSTTGDRLVSAGGDRVARIWRVEGSDAPVELHGHDDDVLYAAFSPDDHFVATSGKDGVVRLWEVESGRQLLAFTAHESAANCVRFSPDGRHLVTAGADKLIRVWLVESGQMVRELQSHQDYVSSAVFARDGQRLASCGGDGTVKIWEVTEKAAYAAAASADLELEIEDRSDSRVAGYASPYAAGKALADAVLKNGIKVTLMQSGGNRHALAVGDPPTTIVSFAGDEVTVQSATGIPLLKLDAATRSVTFDKTDGAAAPWSEGRSDTGGFGGELELERFDSPAAGSLRESGEFELDASGAPDRRYQSFEKHGQALVRDRTSSGRTLRFVRFDADTLYVLFDAHEEPTLVLHGEHLDVRDAKGTAVFRASLRTLEPVVSRRVEPVATAGEGEAGERDPLLVAGSAEMQVDEREPRIHRILSRAVWKKASDIHIPSGAPVQVRRHGRLVHFEAGPFSPVEVEAMLVEVLTSDQRERFESTGDLDFSYEIAGVGRFRANLLRQHRGVDGTFRVIPDSIPSAESLGLPAAVIPLTKHHQGLVLITGPAGQGKSTTIATLVDIINSEKPHHILTVEDPIEFVHPVKRGVVNQREVGRHTKSFSNALRAALREDPDVIVVGEMRDLETISLAITASETGHLVFGSLMTTSAAQTIDRVLDSFPAAQQMQIRTMLSESLKGIVSQQLVPTADGEGRVLACEVLLGTAAVANLIREKKTFQLPSVMQTGRNIGMQRMDDALMELLQAGRITPEAAMRYAQDPKTFETRLRPPQAAPGMAPGAMPPPRPR